MPKKMRLQGKSLKKIPAKKKKKLKKTLAYMEKNRKEDTIQLRQKITQQTTFLKEQIENSRILEEKLRGQLRELEMKKLRIEGALTALTHLLTSENV